MIVRVLIDLVIDYTVYYTAKISRLLGYWLIWKSAIQLKYYDFWGIRRFGSLLYR